MEIDILLKYLQSRFFYSQVEILCRLILRVKKFEDALLFLLSHRWHDLQRQSVEKMFVLFRCLGKAFSFFMAARFVYFDFFYLTIEVALIPTLMLFFSLPQPRRKSVILVLRKVADVFKLNDEKRSHFLIDEIFQVAMFLQWNLIVEHPKIL